MWGMVTLNIEISAYLQRDPFLNDMGCWAMEGFYLSVNISTVSVLRIHLVYQPVPKFSKERCKHTRKTSYPADMFTK
jgi:hypothetical protein